MDTTESQSVVIKSKYLTEQQREELQFINKHLNNNILEYEGAPDRMVQGYYLALFNRIEKLEDRKRLCELVEKYTNFINKMQPDKYKYQLPPRPHAGYHDGEVCTPCIRYGEFNDTRYGRGLEFIDFFTLHPKDFTKEVVECIKIQKQLGDSLNVSLIPNDARGGNPLGKLAAHVVAETLNPGSSGIGGFLVPRQREKDVDKNGKAADKSKDASAQRRIDILTNQLGNPASLARAVRTNPPFAALAPKPGASTTVAGVAAGKVELAGKQKSRL